MYVMTQDPDTGEQVPTTFVAESAITNAIAAVTAARDPVVYFLTGHGEKELPQLLSDRIQAAFYDVREFPLATTGVVPGDADIVVDVSPQTDYTPLEEQALVDFLRQRGGKLLLMTDLGASAQSNVGRLLEAFGLAIRPWLVVERAGEHMLPNQPYVLIPSLGSHEITAASQKSDMPILFPVSQVLEKLSAVRRTVTIDPLLVTSDRAYAKVNINDESGEKRPGDRDGPFVLAAAVTDSGEVGETASRMVVMASSHFLFPSESMGRLEENENFFLSCLAWLQNRPELIAIPPRTIAGSRYAVNLSAFQFLLFGGIAVILIPGMVFAAGLVLWLRRRHR
jgi:ABC-2 type transport system permease protein